MANLYVLEATAKSVVYSVKLKLEFAVLSQLITFFGGARNNQSCEPATFGGNQDDWTSMGHETVDQSDSHRSETVNTPRTEPRSLENL